MIATGLAGAAAVAVMITAAASPQPPLASPFSTADSIAAAVPAGGSRCPPAPPGVRDVLTVSKYGQDRRDNDSTVIDPDDAAEYAQSTRPVLDFTRRVSRLSDSVPERRDTAARDARCALSWLDTWAQDNALLGRTNDAGEAVRKWELATLATAYLKIRQAPHDPDKAVRVRRWLQRVAAAVRQDYSRDLKADSRSNNHINWAAWAVMAAAIAADDRDLFDWSMDRFRYALAQIGPDGTLPLELKRRQLAVAYHDFALAPLVLMREGAARNGVSLSSEDDARLQRLVDRVLTSLADPSYMAQRAGYEQDLSKLSNSQLAWLEVYFARTGDPRAGNLIVARRPLSSSRLGGNLTALFAPQPGPPQPAVR